MTGTRFGCGIAQWGACTVQIDGEPVRSCLLPVGAIGDRKITTIEGIGETIGAGRKLQKAWLDLEVVQCGHCQSGQIISADVLYGPMTAREKGRRHGRALQHTIRRSGSMAECANTRRSRKAARTDHADLSR